MGLDEVFLGWIVSDDMHSLWLKLKPVFLAFDLFEARIGRRERILGIQGKKEDRIDPVFHRLQKRIGNRRGAVAHADVDVCMKL